MCQVCQPEKSGKMSFIVYVDPKSSEFCQSLKNRITMLGEVLKIDSNRKMEPVFINGNLSEGNMRTLLFNCLERCEKDFIFIVSRGVKIKSSPINAINTESSIDWVRLCMDAKSKNTRFHFISNIPFSEDRSFYVFAAQMTGGYCLSWDIQNQNIEQMLFEIVYGFKLNCVRFVNFSSYDFSKSDETNCGFLPTLNQQNRNLNHFNTSKLSSGLGLIGNSQMTQRRRYTVSQKMRIVEYQIESLNTLELLNLESYDNAFFERMTQLFNDNMLNDRWWELIQLHPYSTKLCLEMRKRKMFFNDSKKLKILMQNGTSCALFVKKIWFQRPSPIDQNWIGDKIERFVVPFVPMNMNSQTLFQSIRNRTFDLGVYISQIIVTDSELGMDINTDCDAVFENIFSLFIRDFRIVSKELKTNVALIAINLKNCALYEKAKEFLIRHPPKARSLSRKLCTLIIECNRKHLGNILNTLDYKKRLIRKGLIKNQKVRFPFGDLSIKVNQLIKANGIETLVHKLLNLPLKHPRLIKWKKHLKKPLENQSELIKILNEIVQNGEYFKQSCHMCFIDKRWESVVKPCTESLCSAVACKDCLKKWYNSNQPGKLWNSSRIKCPFCKKEPQISFLIQYNQDLFKLQTIEENEDEHTYYAWCKKCNKVTEYCPKECAQQEIPNPQKFGCTDCKGKTGARPCPRCGHGVIKSEGCNHIRCVCGGHWCYQCGKEFDELVIYDHMRNEHGDIFTRDEQPEEEFD